jgi:ATP/maltotriose-dependent transcriptional regulator MalT
MANPVIATKLHVPRLRANTVHRQRLLDLLEHGAQTRLTLLSAPAGFGKTTLLVGWLAARKTARRAVGGFRSIKPTMRPPRSGRISSRPSGAPRRN